MEREWRFSPNFANLLPFCFQMLWPKKVDLSKLWLSEEGELEKSFFCFLSLCKSNKNAFSKIAKMNHLDALGWKRGTIALRNVFFFSSSSILLSIFFSKKSNIWLIRVFFTANQNVLFFCSHKNWHFLQLAISSALSQLSFFLFCLCNYVAQVSRTDAKLTIHLEAKS